MQSDVQLDHPDPAVRRRSAETLRETPRPEALPALVRGLGDPSPGVREAVEEAILAARGPECVTALLPLLDSEDPPLRNAAVELLKKVGSEDEESLARAARGPKIDARIFLADVLGDLRGEPSFAALLGFLKDPNPNVCSVAVASLGRRGDPRAVPALLPLLRGSEWVRFAAADSLAALRCPECAEAVAALLQEEHLPVLNALLGIVEAAPDEGYVEPLIARMASDPALAPVLSGALRGLYGALGRAPDPALLVPRLLPAFRAARGLASPWDRRSVLRWMRCLSCAETIALAEEFLDDSSEPVLIEAIDFLGESAMTEIPPLERFRRHPDSAVRAAADGAVRRILDRGASA